MFFLIGSIICSSYLTLSFKVLQRYGIPVFPSIVINYLTAVATGSVLNGAFPINSEAVNSGWFVWAVVLGSLFITIFNVIAVTTQKMGVAVASVANKLSLVIPAVFFILYNNESAGIYKILGMALALVAVLLTCYTGGQPASRGISGLQAILLPVILFIGSGAIDTIFKFVEQQHLNQGNLNAFLICAFAVAGVTGLAILVYRLATGKQAFDARFIIAGIAIGIPNYFSIWFLGKVYKEKLMEGSAIIPVNNMGIVLFSTVMAWLLFKEKLSKINWLGIGISLAAIALIAFSGKLS
jgi:drug/metabolite transporter (DMT)-like permease